MAARCWRPGTRMKLYRAGLLCLLSLPALSGFHSARWTSSRLPHAATAARSRPVQTLQFAVAGRRKQGHIGQGRRLQLRAVSDKPTVVVAAKAPSEASGAPDSGQSEGLPVLNTRDLVGSVLAPLGSVKRFIPRLSLDDPITEEETRELRKLSDEYDRDAIVAWGARRSVSKRAPVCVYACSSFHAKAVAAAECQSDAYVSVHGQARHLEQSALCAGRGLFQGPSSVATGGGVACSGEDAGTGVGVWGGGGVGVWGCGGCCAMTSPSVALN